MSSPTVRAALSDNIPLKYEGKNDEPEPLPQACHLEQLPSARRSPVFKPSNAPNVSDKKIQDSHHIRQAMQDYDEDRTYENDSIDGSSVEESSEAAAGQELSTPYEATVIDTQTSEGIVTDTPPTSPCRYADTGVMTSARHNNISPPRSPMTLDTYTHMSYRRYASDDIDMDSDPGADRVNICNDVPLTHENVRGFLEARDRSRSRGREKRVTAHRNAHHSPDGKIYHAEAWFTTDEESSACEVVEPNVCQSVYTSRSATPEQRPYVPNERLYKPKEAVKFVQPPWRVRLNPTDISETSHHPTEVTFS